MKKTANILKPFSRHLIGKGQKDDFWVADYPRAKCRPEFYYQDGMLVIAGGGRPNPVGGWLFRTKRIKAGAEYHCRLKYRAENITSDKSVIGKIFWEPFGLNKKGGIGAAMSGRCEEFLLPEGAPDSAGWITLEKKVSVPPGSEYLVIKLYLMGSPQGKVYFKDPGCFPVSVKPDNYATVAVTNAAPPRSFNYRQIIDFHVSQIDRPEMKSVDIVALPEALNGYEPDFKAVSYTLDEAAETIPGPTTERFAKIARKYRTNIIFGLHEKVGSEIFNTAVLLDRKGNIAGKYRKVSLTFGELSWGISAGNSLPVFETDIGKIGILICYDGHFPENYRVLKLGGAQIVFLIMWSVMLWEKILPAHAFENGIHIAASACNGKSAIITPGGYILAHHTSAPGLLTHKINLDQSDENWCGDKVTEHFIYGRRPDLYGKLRETNNFFIGR